MGAKKYSTSVKGIRYREHPTRKHGVKKDRYYFLRYQHGGKRKEEGLGWASEGMNLNKATSILAELKESARLGKDIIRLKDHREDRDKKIAEKESRLEAERKAAITFNDFFTDTYIPRAMLSKKENSCKVEQGLFDNWLSPCFGSKSLAEITFKDIEQVKWNMLKAKLSPATIKYAIATTRQAFNYASKLGIFKGDSPAAKVKAPKFDNKRERFLSQDEATQLIKALEMRSLQVRDIAFLSLYSGLRSAEIFNLKETDLDFENSIIMVRDTKSGRNRPVPMTGSVKKMLKTYRPDSSYVFKAANGGKIQLLSKTFARTVKEIGLNPEDTDNRQKVVFHTLRHTFASWLVQNGSPLYSVGQLLGHSTVQMTARYSHLAPDHMKDAINSLESMNITDSVPGSKVINLPK